MKWRGLWTWPPWVICAPAFNHKLKKFCIYRGFSEIVFLRKPHKRTEEIRTAQWRGYYKEHWGAPQPDYKFRMAERRMKFQETQLFLDVTLHCSVLVFPLQKLLCWKFRNFLLRNIALVYLLTYIIAFISWIGQRNSFWCFFPNPIKISSKSMTQGERGIHVTSSWLLYVPNRFAYYYSC